MSNAPAEKKLTMPIGDLLVRRLRVRASEVVFIKGVIEASEGLAVVFAERGGDLTIATSASQKDEFDRILQDLANETGAVLEEPAQTRAPIDEGATT